MGSYLTVLFTVIGSFFVFLFGQFVLKYMIEPIIEQKKLVGEVIEIVIRFKSDLLNCPKYSDEKKEKIQREFIDITSRLTASLMAIPCYDVLLNFGLVKSHDVILNIIKKMNFLSYFPSQYPSSNPEWSKPNENRKVILELEEILDLKFKLLEVAERIKSNG